MFAFSFLGNSEETVGEGRGLGRGERINQAVGPSFGGAWGIGRGNRERGPVEILRWD